MVSFAKFDRTLQKVGDVAHDDGWHTPDVYHAPSINLPDSRIRQWLVTTKPQWLFNVFGNETPLPDATGLIVRPTLLTRAYLKFFRQLFDAYPVPIKFVGDLDPYDLSIFLQLHLFNIKKNIRWIGVGDLWFETMDIPWTDHRMRSATIEMTPFERKFVRQLHEIGIDIPGLTGEGAANLLIGGCKIELEGASHPDIFGKSVPRLRSLVTPKKTRSGR